MKQRIKAAVKIIMAVCIAATVALSSAGCVKDRRALYNENSEARRYAQICSELGELVRKDFYHADAEYASHYVPEKPDDASIAFLWPYMELIAQVYREKTLYSDKDYLSDVYAKLIDELEYYKRLGGDGLLKWYATLSIHSLYHIIVDKYSHIKEYSLIIFIATKVLYRFPKLWQFFDA